MNEIHYCEDCAQRHRAVPAVYRYDWDLGSAWLCQDCLDFRKINLLPTESRR